MPRIAVCLNIADSEKPHFSGENLHLDYCRECYRLVDAGDLAASHGLPDEAVDCEVEHPGYETWDYTCESCGAELGMEDN